MYKRTVTVRKQPLPERSIQRSTDSKLMAGSHRVITALAVLCHMHESMLIHSISLPTPLNITSAPLAIRPSHIRRPQPPDTASSSLDNLPFHTALTTCNWHLLLLLCIPSRRHRSALQRLRHRFLLLRRPARNPPFHTPRHQLSRPQISKEQLAAAFNDKAEGEIGNHRCSELDLELYCVSYTLAGLSVTKRECWKKLTSVTIGTSCNQLLSSGMNSVAPV